MLITVSVSQLPNRAHALLVNFVRSLTLCYDGRAVQGTVCDN